MNKILKNQIEKIIDESTTKNVDVLIKLAHENGDLKRYVNISSEVISNRSANVSARNLIPPPKDILPADSSDKKKMRKLSTSRLSMTKTLHASYKYQFQEKQALKRKNQDSLKPLISSSIGKKLSKDMKGFWSSKSARMSMTKDDLYKIPKEVPNISSVYPNRLIKMPPVTKSNSLPAIVEDNKGYTWGLAKTGALATWGVFEAKGDGVKVAVLDTGVDPEHPDLVSKISDFAEFDKNGFTIKQGINAAYDSGEHGTHCAGTIAGGNASGRWIGMAPGAKIMAGLVLKKGIGYDAQILAGMEWAIDNGADVISMSLGGLQLGPIVLDIYTEQILTARQLGIPVVISVGNEGSQTSGSPGNNFFALTVGATNHDDNVAGFSGGRTQLIEHSDFIDPLYLPFSYSKPEISAPGVDIFSCVPGGKHEAWNGTSMAAPHVAGAIALLLSKEGQVQNLSGLQRVELINSLILGTVKDLGEAGQDHRYGIGRLDVLRAVGFAQELGYW